MSPSPPMSQAESPQRSFHARFKLGLLLTIGLPMALETGTYISDLVSTNPVGTDTLDKADDHLRLIKSTVKATFPNITGAVTATHTELNTLESLIDSTSGRGFLRNRIINGDMRIDQRNAGAAVNTDNTWPVDRWNQSMQGGGVLSGQRSTTAPAGHINSLAFTVTTADASIAASDLYCVQHKIEGYNVSDLGWGAAGAQSVTISFWVRASVTGTYACSVVNSAFTRGYTATYTISAANTWEQKTITIAGDTSGTWLTDTGMGIRVYFDLGSGTTYNAAAANTWSGAPGLRTAGTVSPISTLSATFYITGVQLEAGSVATPFERRQYGQELALCQRYFQQVGGTTGLAWATGQGSGSGSSTASVPFQTAMRVAPSLTVVSTGFNAGDNALGPVTATVTLSTATAINAMLSYSHAALTSNAARVLQTTNATSFLQFSAEL